MSFAAHSVRKNVEAQRRNDAVTVFVVGAHHAHVCGATGQDLQVHSPWGRRPQTIPRAPLRALKIHVIRGGMSAKGGASY
jgi:hypothetical protein